MKFIKKQATEEQIEFCYIRTKSRIIGYLIGCLLTLIVCIICGIVGADWYEVKKEVVTGELILLLLEVFSLSYLLAGLLEVVWYKRSIRDGYTYYEKERK